VPPGAPIAMKLPEIRTTILRIKPYVPGKPIEEVQRELGIEDVIKLASNENPLGPSPKGMEALQEAAGRIHIYPDSNCYYLKEALAKHLSVAPEQLIIGNGSDEILKMLGEAFLTPEDEVVLSEHTFSVYQFVARLMGAGEVVVPMKDYTVDLEAMAKAVGPKTKMVFICNPNNPTGTFVGADELDRFLDAVPPGVLVVMDEAYYEYVDDPSYPDTVAMLPSRKNLVILRTFSKIYGLAGLRVGYGIGNPEVIAAINRVREPFNVNSLAQAAAVAALADEEFLQQSRAVNRAGKEFLYQEFERLGLSFLPSQSNFILVDVGMDSQQLMGAMLQRGVIIRAADSFGLPGFIRVTIGREQDNRRFIDALIDVLEKEGGVRL
jgi:histidinol-phosphate aminotransferase